MSVNSVTLVSDDLSSLAEPEAVRSNKISINNIMVTITRDRIIKVFLLKLN